MPIQTDRVAWRKRYAKSIINGLKWRKFLGDSGKQIPIDSPAGMQGPPDKRNTW